MSRLLLLIAILFLLWWLWQRRQKRSSLPTTVQPRDADTAIPMVACQHCRLHVPQDRAIQQDGRWYCCPEHARQDDRPEQH